MTKILWELSIVCTVFRFWSLKSLVQGQTAVLSGTNYVSGSGFCFGDQQLKEGTPFISCTSSGFTGQVTSYVVFWTINGVSDLTVEQVEVMYPNQLDSVTVPQPNEFQLNILNITSLGVSSITCRISAFNGAVPLGVTPLSTVESISVVNTVPAPEMPRVTPSYTSAEVTVNKPSGLCEGLRSGQITYEFNVYRSNSLVTTENVTTSGPTTSATLSGLNSTTEYRVEIHGNIDVVSQAMALSVTFTTLGDVNECDHDPGPCHHICRNTIGSYTCSCVSGYVLADDGVTCNSQESSSCTPGVPVGISVAVTFIATVGMSSSVAAVLMCLLCKKKKKLGAVKEKGADGDIYEDPDKTDVKMELSPAYQTVSLGHV